VVAEVVVDPEGDDLKYRTTEDLFRILCFFVVIEELGKTPADFVVRKLFFNFKIELKRKKWQEMCLVKSIA